jgi:hypothetical protein
MSEPPAPIPQAALWLGTGGLVPFVLLTGALYALPQANAAVLLFWLTAYATAILSFVGAIHWGIALAHPSMSDSDRSVFMTWSVVPALAAWVALLLPARTGILLMIATFIVHYAADRQLAQRFVLPAWYLKLRVALTGVAVLCLLLAMLWLARQ